MHSTVGRTTTPVLYNAALGQQKPRATPSPSGEAKGVTITPSAKLLKPFYWTAAILAGLILAYSNNMNWNLYPALAIPAAIVAWTLVRHLHLRFTRLTVTASRLRYETGVFSRSVRNMELAKVQNVRVDQTFLNRLLSLGTISIETAGESSLLSVAGIEDPQQVADYILEAARK